MQKLDYKFLKKIKFVVAELFEMKLKTKAANSVRFTESNSSIGQQYTSLRTRERRKERQRVPATPSYESAPHVL